MSKSTRHLINAAICLVVALHAVYWFMRGGAELATNFRIGLVVAQALVGFFGTVWFYSRSRGASS